MKNRIFMFLYAVLVLMGILSLSVFAATSGEEVQNPFVQMATPIIALLDMVISPAILLVGSLGSIYCIMLGVKLAKAEEQQDREKAKGSLKNAIIGFMLIFILVVTLKVGIKPMSEWMNKQSTVASLNVSMQL